VVRSEVQKNEAVVEDISPTLLTVEEEEEERIEEAVTGDHEINLGAPVRRPTDRSLSGPRANASKVRSCPSSEP